MSRCGAINEKNSCESVNRGSAHSAVAGKRNYCAGVVLVLQHAPPKTNQKQKAKSLVVVGSGGSALVPVAVELLLKTAVQDRLLPVGSAGITDAIRSIVSSDRQWTCNAIPWKCPKDPEVVSVHRKSEASYVESEPECRSPKDFR